MRAFNQREWPTEIVFHSRAGVGVAARRRILRHLCVGYLSALRARLQRGSDLSQQGRRAYDAWLDADALSAQYRPHLSRLVCAPKNGAMRGLARRHQLCREPPFLNELC
jgi:hypothetical protein